MVDITDAQTRSRMMAGIKGKNTKPEMLVRRTLFSKGYRYRLHGSDLAGAPDIVMKNRKVAIFVHGCFWHMHQGCRLAKLPATRPEFWANKLATNVARDQRNIAALRAQGWRVLIVWECATKVPIQQAALANALLSWIEDGTAEGDISDQTLLESR